jgi:ADP-heptose:LPS heptosyltransferase
MRVRLERWGRNALAQIIGLAFPLRKTSAEAVRQQWAEGPIRKVLLVRPHQGLGDLLLATPLLRALKTSRPDVQLHFLADRYNVGAVLGNTRIDKLWTWEKKKARAPMYLISFINALRAERYDLAIIISSHTPSFTSFLLARASGAKVTWAFATEPHYDGANWSQWLASVAVPNPPENAPECVKFMDLLKPLGVQGVCEPEFHVTPEVKAWSDAYWQKYAFPSNRPVVALFLGGNPERPDRLWPAEAWAQLARMLMDKSQATVLAILPPKKLLSGSGQPEPGIYEDFSQVLGQRLAVFDEPGLKQAAALLSHADVFVCPDGGLMHVAIAARVPTVGLYFGTDPMRWVPPVSWAVGLRAPDGRPSGLLPEAVYTAVVRRLKTHAGVR